MNELLPKRECALHRAAGFSTAAARRPNEILKALKFNSAEGCGGPTARSAPAERDRWRHVTAEEAVASQRTWRATARRSRLSAYLKTGSLGVLLIVCLATLSRRLKSRFQAVPIAPRRGSTSRGELDRLSIALPSDQDRKAQCRGQHAQMAERYRLSKLLQHSLLPRSV